MSASYVDYSVFQGPKFDARQYANSLLLSTTDRDELLIDFTSAENKIKFDLEEVDASIKSVIESNWEDLLERTELAAACTEDIAEIEKSLKMSIAAYETMAAKALTPYEEAEPNHDSLINLASTISLLRSLAHYLDQIARLDAANNLLDCTNVLADLARSVRENQALLQLRIVVSNFAKIDSRKAQVLRECTLCLTESRNMATAISALHKLDPQELDKLLKRTIDNALNEASKTFKSSLEVTAPILRLQNSDNTKAISLYSDKLQTAFQHLGRIATRLDHLEEECPPELLQSILENLCDASASMRQFYWRELSGRISQSTREATRSNQWILRTIRSANTESIVSFGLPKGTMEFSVVHGSFSRR